MFKSLIGDSKSANNKKNKIVAYSQNDNFKLFSQLIEIESKIGTFANGDQIVSTPEIDYILKVLTAEKIIHGYTYATQIGRTFVIPWSNMQAFIPLQWSLFGEKQQLTKTLV